MKLIKILPVVLVGLVLSMNAGATTIHDKDTMNPGISVSVENWMFDTNYLSGVAQTVEDWMFDTNWLEQAPEEAPVETWMLDENYLLDNGQGVESWMLDPGYLGGQCDNVN